MSVQDKATEIKDTFAFLDDWEMRYEHIIDLGKSLPPLSDADMTEAFRVRGCSSQVWIVPETGENPQAVYFRAQSDAMIVAGLISLLKDLFYGEAASEILAFDAPGFFSEIGLDEALSAQRANGLRSMLERIRLLASEIH